MTNFFSTPPQNRYNCEVGDGKNSKFRVTHNFGTTDVLTLVFDKENGLPRLVGTEVIDENTVEVNFEQIAAVVDGEGAVLPAEIPAPFSQIVSVVVNN